MGDYTGMTAATDPLVLADSYAMSATTYRPRPLIPGGCPIRQYSTRDPRSSHAVEVLVRPPGTRREPQQLRILPGEGLGQARTRDGN